MRGKRFATAVAGALMAVALSATGASAATQVGNDCVVADGAANVAAVQLSRDPSSPFPISVPTAGVVTKWKLTLPVTEEKVPTKMLVFRPTADPTQFSNIGESPTVSAVQGVNIFDVRIPVQVGDRIGTGGAAPGGALFCETTSTTDVIGGGAIPPVGSTMTITEEETKGAIGVVATVEPDADGDGFGDETQDLCPQSALAQAACPLVALDAFPFAGKGAITVYVSTSIDASVTVSGAATVPKVKSKASSSAKAKLKKVTKSVKPGTIGKFKLKLPGKLKSALAALPPSKSVTVKITSSAKNAAGTVTKDKTKLKLKGTG